MYPFCTSNNLTYKTCLGRLKYVKKNREITTIQFEQRKSCQIAVWTSRIENNVKKIVSKKIVKLNKMNFEDRK